MVVLGHFSEIWQKAVAVRLALLLVVLAVSW
jgi:hypothetical protein